MKYSVNFGIDKFEFDDGSTAISFSELAVKHFTPSEYNKELKPTITIKGDEKDETAD